MRVVVSRKTWLRGEGSQPSCLHRASDGKRCCFGFVANQCGISDAEMANSRAISSLLDYLPQAQEKLGGFARGAYAEHEWVESAYKANDSQDIDDNTREQRLATLFAANGHEIVFED